MKLISIMLVFFVFLIAPLQAQDDDPDFAPVIAACDDLAPNEVCYGDGTVNLLVDCELATDFDAPGARENLESVCLLRTHDAGVALMNLEVEDGAVWMAAVGEVEMQSVSGGQVGQEAVVEETTPIYSGPGSQYDTVGTLEVGTAIMVNACNCTRNWLRILQGDGEVGWVPARRISIGDVELPEVTVDTPVFAAMQHVTLVTGDDDSGLLVQVVDAPALLQINGVMLELDATAYVRSRHNEAMEIDILQGEGRVSSDELALYVPAGGHVIVALDENHASTGEMLVELVTPDHLARMPLALLPQPIDPIAVLDETQPSIVGVELCSVVSDLGEVACPLHFINPDGDEIVQMDVEFVYAPVGEWEGSSNPMPTLSAGDLTAGILDWTISCSLATENFIGPVQWLITLEDAAGNRSVPFEAAFNCIDG